MKQKHWIWLAPVVLAAVVAGLLAFRPPVPPGVTLARIEREGVIRIGCAPEAPYVFLDARGTFTGEEIEVAKIIASRMGIRRIEWCQTDFGSLIPELEAGRFDVIAAGMFITAERARRVIFSEPTFRVRNALLVRTGNPHGLHSHEDIIRQSQVKIAVLHGSIEEAMIRKIGVPDDRISVVPDALTGRVAVESGLVDCLALSSPTVRFMARQQNLGLSEIAQPFVVPVSNDARHVGFGANAFRKADDDLRVAWNRHLRAFLGSAEHRRLLAEFGFSDDELPGEITTSEILSSGAK